jgi:hypothetical protein
MTLRAQIDIADVSRSVFGVGQATGGQHKSHRSHRSHTSH